MNDFRIALANLRFPSTPKHSIALVEDAIAKAGDEGAGLVCFPECYVPGYRGFGMVVGCPVLCRAAENTCYFAWVNCASDRSPSTSAVVRPDGSLLCYQPYGKEGLLIADIDLGLASGLFASRCKYACDDA
jgi:predicted amidohydrolase